MPHHVKIHVSGGTETEVGVLASGPIPVPKVRDWCTMYVEERSIGSQPSTDPNRPKQATGHATGVFVDLMSGPTRLAPAGDHTHVLENVGTTGITTHERPGRTDKQHGRLRAAADEDPRRGRDWPTRRHNLYPHVVLDSVVTRREPWPIK